MLDKLTKDLINKMVLEFNKSDNKKKIEKEIINPIFCNFADKIYPYVSLLFIMYSLNLILIIVVLILIIINNKKS
jgi:hypothetical protein